MPLSKAIQYLILLSIFLIPINGVRGLPFFGELSEEAFIYPLIIANLLFLFSLKVKLPRNKILIISLLLISILSLILNFQSISTSVFKGSSGFFRFVSQFCILLFFIHTSLLVSWIVNRYYSQIGFFYTLRGVMMLSFTACSVFTVLLELPYILGFDFSTDLLSLFNDILRGNEGAVYERRLRSLSFEAPAFANFLAICLPFGLSFYLTNQKFKGHFFLLFFIPFMILTVSRTALFLTLIELALFFYFSTKVFRGEMISVQLKKYLILIIFLFSTLETATNFGATKYVFSKVSSVGIEENSENQHLVSNLGRWGAQYASLLTFFEHPIVGVGLGQQGYYMKDNFPKWSQLSYQVQNWMDKDHENWPPAFSTYTRLLAELGLLGAVVFLLIGRKYTLVFLNSSRRSYDVDKKVVYFTYFIAFASCLLVFLQYGSFRLLFFWVFLGLAFSLNNKDE